MPSEYQVILFYKFINIAEPEKLRREQFDLCNSLNLKGRIIVAKEGINGTLEGFKKDIANYKTKMHEDERFADIVFKESEGSGHAFPKLKVKARKEVVTLEAGEFDIARETAETVSADQLEEWYAKNEDFVVLDLRNKYEIESGYFERTIDPGLENFRDLPQKINELKELKDKKIVAVCTGGIRCEKATCLLKREGFSNLYQLQDGIHTYMVKYPAKHFKGSLYVFDNRITSRVKEGNQYEMVGKCFYCQTLTEQYANDDSVRPSKKIVCCSDCFKQNEHKLRGIVVEV